VERWVGFADIGEDGGGGGEEWGDVDLRDNHGVRLENYEKKRFWCVLKNN